MHRGSIKLQGTQSQSIEGESGTAHTHWCGAFFSRPLPYSKTRATSISPGTMRQPWVQDINDTPKHFRLNRSNSLGSCIKTQSNITQPCVNILPATPQHRCDHLCIFVEGGNQKGLVLSLIAGTRFSFAPLTAEMEAQNGSGHRRTSTLWLSPLPAPLAAAAYLQLLEVLLLDLFLHHVRLVLHLAHLLHGAVRLYFRHCLFSPPLLLPLGSGLAS